MVDSQDFESYIPVYDTVPEKWEEARQFLVEHLKKISNAINIREIGWFLDQELLSGKQFIPGSANNQEYRTVLRKVIDFGSLPNNATKSVAHGITFDANFTLMQLYGAATRPSTAAIPIPYVQVAGGLLVQIYIDPTNINIITNADFTSYTRCFVVVEYIQEQ